VREKKRVDDDWKRRAAEEKAKIAGQFSPPTRSEPEASMAGEPESTGGDPGDPSSEVSTDPNFVRLISTLGGQAMMALGMAEDPHSGERFLDLDLARQLIDMLGALEARSRGNLSAEEDQILSEVLHQLRLSYSQRVQQAQQAAMSQPPPGTEPEASDS